MYKEKYNIDLDKQLELTGYYADKINEDNYSYTNLVLTDKQYNDMLANNEFYDCINEIGSDFVCVKRIGTIDFVHSTTEDRINGIKNQGLLPVTDWIHRLGIGIYGVFNTKEGLNALKSYIEDNLGGNVTLLFGIYEGEYIECIYDELFDECSHVGYIVMKIDKINTENIKDIKSYKGVF